MAVPDVGDMTPQQAEEKLKEVSLTAQLSGEGEKVLSQIPAPGQIVPAGSEILLYLSRQQPLPMVAVPDFTGMQRQQAEDAAGALGLYLLVTGNNALSPSVVVTGQSIAPDTQVPGGTTIQLEFTDITAKDG